MITQLICNGKYSFLICIGKKRKPNTKYFYMKKDFETRVVLIKQTNFWTLLHKEEKLNQLCFCSNRYIASSDLNFDITFNIYSRHEWILNLVLVPSPQVALHEVHCE